MQSRHAVSDDGVFLTSFEPAHVTLSTVQARPVTWDRDVNAARNILFNFINMLRAGRYPEQFLREHVLPKLKK